MFEESTSVQQQQNKELDKELIRQQMMAGSFDDVFHGDIDSDSSDSSDSDEPAA